MQGPKPKKSRLRKAFIAAVTVLGLGSITGGIEQLPKDPMTDTQKITTQYQGSEAVSGYNISLVDQMWKTTLSMKSAETLAQDMMEASDKGDSWRVQALLDQGTMDIYSPRTHDAFAMAALRGHMDVVKTFLKAGIDPAANDGAALVSAVRGQNSEIALMLMQKGVSGASQDSAALLAAIVQNNAGMADALIAHGADVKAHDSLALQYAATYGDENMLATMLSNGADAKAGDSAALRAAAAEGKLEAVKTLVAAGGNLAARDSEALIVAAGSGNADLVKFILDQKTSYTVPGFDFDYGFMGHTLKPAGDYSLSPSDYYGPFSAYTGSYSLRTVNVHAQGEAALAAAVSIGNVETVRVLLDAGASIDSGTMPPLATAVFSNDYTMTMYLLSRGANPNADNGSALYLATSANNGVMAQLLMNNGADANARNGAIKDIAKKSGNKDIQKVLDGQQVPSFNPYYGF